MPDLRTSSRPLAGDSGGTVEEVLRRTRTLAEWPIEAIDALSCRASLRTHEAGQMLAAAGDRVGGVWVVRSGLLETAIVWRSGKRMIADFLEPGRMTGHLAVIDGLPLAFTVTARRPSTTVFIPGEAFNDCLSAHPRAMAAMLRMLCRGIRLEYDRDEVLAMNGIRARIAKALLYLGRSGMAQPGEIEVRISQDDIAAWLVVRRQTVNEELAWFVDEGVLARRYGGLIIRDIDRLLATAYAEEPLSEASRLNHAPPRDGLLRASD